MKSQKDEAKKLQAKYLQDEIFQKEVDDRFKKYHVLLQQSLYSDLTCISQDLFVCYNRGEYPIYFYFGMLENSGKEQLHKLAMYLVKFFNRKPTELYGLVFVNTNADSEAYCRFKEVFLQLTMDHFLYLKELILLRPSYYHRAQDYMSFNVFTNYIRTLTTHFYSGAELCTYLKMSPQDFVDIVPKEIAQVEFPNYIARKLSLEDQRVNFSGHLLDQHEKALRKEFETVMKSFLISKPGKETFNISDYELNKFGIPVVLEILIYYFRAHPQGLKLEGLFRKSVSIDEQNQTLTELVNKNYDCLLTVSNPHIIANLIKRFFSNLKVPVFPYSQFETLMHDQGVSDKKQYIRDVVLTLPDLNYSCLLFLLQFLRTDVIFNSVFNKMTAQNISICFAPCLLRAEKASAADLIYASKCAFTTRILLQNFGQIFGDKQAIEKRFRKSEQVKTENMEAQIQQSIMADKNERLSKDCAFKIIKRIPTIKNVEPEIASNETEGTIKFADNANTQSSKLMLVSIRSSKDKQEVTVLSLRKSAQKNERKPETTLIQVQALPSE